MNFPLLDQEEEHLLAMEKKIWGSDQVAIMLIHVLITLMFNRNTKEQLHLALADKYESNYYK